MFFIYHKFLTGIVFLLLLLCPSTISSAAHADFTRITFQPGSTASLIEDMSKERINQAYDSVKRKGFGWQHYTIYKDVPLRYEGNVVFSKANRTSRELSFQYTYEVENTAETSVSVSGDISLTLSGKIKQINGSLNGKIRKEIGEKTRIVIDEQIRTTFLIPAYTKLTVQLKGEARLNNGVAKYYFLGMRFKKGTWEIIDKVTEYYDYYEETV